MYMSVPSLLSSVPVGRLPACCPLMLERETLDGGGAFGVERPPTARPFNALAWLSDWYNQSHRTTSSPPRWSARPSTPLRSKFLETCFCTYIQECLPATKLSDCQMKLAASTLHRQGHQPIAPRLFVCGCQGCRISLVLRPARIAELSETFSHHRRPPYWHPQHVSMWRRPGLGILFVDVQIKLIANKCENSPRPPAAGRVPLGRFRYSFASARCQRLDKIAAQHGKQNHQASHHK